MNQTREPNEHGRWICAAVATLAVLIASSNGLAQSADASAATANSAAGVGGLNPLAVLSNAAETLRANRASDSASSEDGWNAGDGEAFGPLLSSAMPDPAREKSGGGKNATEGKGLSSAINILLVLTVISLAPSIMLMTTCFVRIVVVLGLLKQALGTQTLPPPQVTLGLSLFMTLLVMSPTIDRVYKEAVVPYQEGTIRDYDTLWVKARQPVRDFMFDQIERTGNWSSVYMVLNYRGIDTSDPSKLKFSDVDMVSLVPAYMLSELKTAFLIGFKVYLPFLVIDMVIAAMLISMGMMMLPPVLISLPFKLLLFVLVDGWMLVVGSLMQSFAVRPMAGGGGSGGDGRVSSAIGEGVVWVVQGSRVLVESFG